MNAPASLRVPRAGVAAFMLTGLVLTVVHLNARHPLLLLERLIPGAGFAEIFILCGYAAFIAETMIRSNDAKPIRLAIWGAFSVVFFGQLLLGLAGWHVFLMTGKLHLPIPAVIAAGPLYRGEGFFMPLLLVSTVILTGPAWCSYLCYFGVWDNLASLSSPKPSSIKPWMKKIRYAVFLSVIFGAVLFRLLNVPAAYALAAAAGFALAGLLIMLSISRKTGLMAHCLMWCPIGLLTNLLGKISPFRLRLAETCTGCGNCTRVCRYGALPAEQIRLRKPALTCTLCGDCIGTCASASPGYHFLWLSGVRARQFFIVMVVSLHAVFLGLARI